MSGKKVTEISASSVALLQQDIKMGFLPAKTIALKYGLDIEDMRAVAKRERWPGAEMFETPPEPPLQQAIEQAALQATVDRVVSEDDAAKGNTAPRVIDRQATVRQFGLVMAGVQAEHRAIIRRARLYVTTLLQQLEDLVGPHLEKERIRALAQMIGDGDAAYVKMLESSPAAGDLLGGLKVLDARATIMTKLTIALKELIVMERQAYGLDKSGGERAGYDELLEEIHQQRLNGKPK